MSEPGLETKQGLNWKRGFLWLLALGFVCLASVWALIWVACAFSGGEWGPKGGGVLLVLAWGLAPLCLALFVVVVFWRIAGPPFSRSRRKS